MIGEGGTMMTAEGGREWTEKAKGDCVREGV